MFYIITIYAGTCLIQTDVNMTTVQTPTGWPEPP